MSGGSPDEKQALADSGLCGRSLVEVGRERFHHDVYEIAVDGVDAHTKEVAEDSFMLSVPAEAEAIEPVKECGHST